MSRQIPLSEEGLRTKASHHLGYEIETLWLVSHALMEKQRLMTDQAHVITLRDHVAKMALIEAFATHLRNLIDFLYIGSPKPDDVVAEDFFEAPAVWRPDPPEPSPILARARERANKEIVHLTTKRIEGTPPEKGWAVPELLVEITPLLEQFAAGASPKRLGDQVVERVRMLRHTPKLDAASH
jgi:hypothetical protein